MRAITKGGEPACLAAHREQEFSDYANYQGKPVLRASLVSEQRGICCYCMSRIAPNGQQMKIEHWRGQTAYPELQLSYQNLLGACHGNEGEPLVNQHCDTRKGGRDFMVNPAAMPEEIGAGIRYLTNGEIRSDHQQLDQEIDEVLGLNVAGLKNNRKSALDVVLQWLQAIRPDDNQIEAQITKIDDGTSELNPFAPVAVWFLKRKLAT